MTVKIRPITLKDAASYRRCWDAVAKERRYIVEFEAPPLSEVRAILKGILRDKLPFLAAVDEDRVVGWAAVFRSGAPSVRHGGDLGIALLPAYRGMGLGEKLMAGVLKLSRAKFESVFLVVFGKNKSARGLYAKMGFKAFGRIKRAVKGLPYGYDDFVMMQKQLGKR